MLTFSATYMDLHEQAVFPVEEDESLFDILEDILYIMWDLEPTKESNWRTDLATFKACIFKGTRGPVCVEYLWDGSGQITVRDFKV